MQTNVSGVGKALIDIAKLRDLFIRPVQGGTYIRSNLTFSFSSFIPISLAVFQNQVSPKNKAQHYSSTEAHHHGKESGLVLRGLVSKEKLWTDNISCAICNEDLKSELARRIPQAKQR